MCTEVSSSVPHFLQVGSPISPITCRCLFIIIIIIIIGLILVGCLLRARNNHTEKI
jgi:hypothetical protein